MASSDEFRRGLVEFFDRLRKDVFLLVLLAALLVLSVLSPTPFAHYPALVDGATIAALTGLLLLTKGLELSGALERLGHWLIDRMATQRAAALCLVATAAGLSTLLTNDVALFVVVPLTLGVCRLARMPATRLIVFEALAVNAGSALTPIGNPQNLFLWQLAKVPFSQFVWHMLPLVAALMMALLLLTAAAFSGEAVQRQDSDHAASAPAPLDRPLLLVALLLYLPFLLATDMHHAGAAVTVVVLVMLALRPRVLAQLDWGLLLVFVLMFIDLRLLAGLPVVKTAMQGFGLDQAQHLYAASIGASQLISNVPAAIALAEYSHDWKVMAYGVNVGGFGFMVGSLANLIALRMAQDRRAWLSFHGYAIPALVLAALLGWLLLFMAGAGR